MTDLSFVPYVVETNCLTTVSTEVTDIGCLSQKKKSQAKTLFLIFSSQSWRGNELYKKEKLFWHRHCHCSDGPDRAHQWLTSVVDNLKTNYAIPKITAQVVCTSCLSVHSRAEWIDVCLVQFYRIKIYALWCNCQINWSQIEEVRQLEARIGFKRLIEGFW